MSEIEGFECTLKDIRPIVEWVKGKKPHEEGCPPCLIAPLSSYYIGALEGAGEKKLVSELKQVFEEGDILTIAQKLDTIKTDVGEALKKQLRNLDCFAQTFKPH